ncbi:MAG TPA: hypothetical protein VNX18_05225 [Bryobacteraceae bacterium]|nr:hypothetical protein [Bryobacteraceae bacterium]
MAPLKPFVSSRTWVKELGLKIELLSGDSEASARAADSLSEVSSSLLPEQKSACADELIK